MIHRDIKPSNLLLDEEGTVKILDMGLARLEAWPTGETIETEELTLTSSVMGTAAYMAPEQATDSHHADHRADIYSLGCTLYYLITGHSPYREETSVKTILAHREQPIPPLGNGRDDVPEDLIAVYRRMMAKKPEDRYQSMAEVMDALGCCEVAGQSAVSTGLTPVGRAVEQTMEYTRKSSKKTWLWGSTTVVALLLVVAMLVWGGFHGRESKEAELTGTESKTVAKQRPAIAVAPFTAEEAKQYQQAWADYLGVPVEFENSIGMKMVLIPPGEFMMGSTEEEMLAANL